MDDTSHLMRNLTNATIASVLLATALTACANAQSPAAQNKQTIQIQRSQGDGKSVELRVENGEVRVAKLNGEDVPADRVRKVPGGFDIVDASGKVIEHLAVGRANEPGPGGPVPGGAGKVRRGVRIETSDEERVMPKIVAGQRIQGIAIPDGEGDSIVMDHPKAMIGAGLGVPDAALAHHLGIDPSKSTLVTNAINGLPASKAGIEQFDVIVSINGSADASSGKLRRALRDAEPGTKIKLGVRRGAETKSVEVEPVAFDESKLAELDAESDVLVQGMNLGNMVFTNEDGEGDEGGDMMGGAVAGGGMAGGDVVFFIGPDGKRHEMRMPIMPNMPTQNMLPGNFNPQDFNRRMEEFNRRMEELDRRMDQRMRPNQSPNGGFGQGPNAGGPMNNGNNGNNNNNDERMRRLEERMERLMRELERQRNERRGEGKGEDADGDGDGDAAAGQ